jgi:hypothetical protein
MTICMLARKLTYWCILLIAAGSLTCREHIADAPVAHRLPKTFLWLFPDSTLRTGVSRTHLNWWGEAPGGVVRGYLFGFAIVTQNIATLPQPDTIRYTWVTGNDTTLLFPLDTLFRKFVVVVRAVDNIFVGLPERSSVRMKPFPFWDVNGNGVFDGSDVRLGTLEGSTDPAGAVLTFPIRNTPPGIALLLNPNDPSIPQKLPDTTYTAATIGFKGFDDDGDNTLASYRIALNDTGPTGQWLNLSLRDTMVTLVVPRARSDAAGSTVTADVYSGSFLGRRLVGQLSGLRLNAQNVLFVEARDIAGEYSTPIRFPGATDHWYVKKPAGRLLLVSDYISFDAAQAQATYRASLASVTGGAFTQVDFLDIAQGLAGSEKENGKLGSMVPQFVDPALVQTFLLFDYVLWYSDQVPALAVAQRSIFPYLQNGGRVIFSTMFLNTTDPRGALRDFAPIDSVSSVDLSPTRPQPPPPVAGDSRIPGNYVLFPDSSNPGVLYPQLAFNGPAAAIYSVFMRPIYRRSDARYLYRLQPDARNPQRYFGSPNIAVVDGQNTIVFVGLPLHLLGNTVQGNPRGLSAFLEKAIGQFSPTQHVNRRRF